MIIQPGTLVEWVEDYRPDPDKLPEAYQEAAWDMSLVVKERGIVQSIARTFWGNWVALIEHEGRMKEKNIDRLKVV